MKTETEVGYSETQRNRLKELGLCEDEVKRVFSGTAERDRSFHEAEKRASAENRERLTDLLTEKHRPELALLTDSLTKALVDAGFTQVMTPTIISAKALDKMSITAGDALRQQVFWLDKNSCLRPMLAPNLYEVSRKLMNSQPLPMRIFEVGSCFRKESEGNRHLKEFTMLNLVEWGTPLEERSSHLREFAAIVMEAAGIRDYRFEDETSVVYGKGLDVVGSDGLELASSSMGPHPLDDAWKVTCTWTGIGFGLERLLMYREHMNGIHRFSRSNVFLDGAVLKVR